MIFKKSSFKMSYYKTLASLSVGALALTFYNYNKFKRKDDDYSCSLYKLLPSNLSSFLFSKFAHYEFPPFITFGIVSAYSYLTGCDRTEAKERHFKSLASFFTRKLAFKRDISNAELVSPADGRVVHCGKVKNGIIEQVKGVNYSLKAFLGNEKSLAKYLENGNNLKKSLFYCTIYLSPGDYHRFHSPVDWKSDKCKHFSGELYSVSTLFTKFLRGLFVLNERVAVYGTWKHGFFSMVPVGATFVGSIAINGTEEFERKETKERKYYKKFKKGDEVGYFNFGSSVVLVFEAPSDFKFRVGAGDRVKYGEKLI